MRPRDGHAGATRLATSAPLIHLSPEIHNTKFYRTDAATRAAILVNHVKVRVLIGAICDGQQAGGFGRAPRANPAFLAAMRVTDPGAPVAVACRHANRTSCSRYRR